MTGDADQSRTMQLDTPEPGAKSRHKTMKNQTADDLQYIHQVPETAFEQSLMRQVIKASLPKNCPIMFSEVKGDFLLGDEWSADGWLGLKVAIINPCEGDVFGALFETPYFSGRVRILENPFPTSENFRIQIEWEFEPQRDKGYVIINKQINYLPYPPVIAKEVK